jgi:methionyl aminopeptidase
MGITLKTAEEIEILREGGKRLATILYALEKLVAPGVDCAYLNEVAEKMIRDNGDQPSFLHYQPQGASRKYPASLCVSVNDEVVHGIPNEKQKILKEGDIVSLDLGLKHRGMFTDMAITVPVGKISPQLAKLLKTTHDALMAGIDVVKAGKRVSEVSGAIEDFIKPTGYGIVEGLSGHGVGHAIHEDPFVPIYRSGGTGPVMKMGLVIALEPMLTLGKKDVVLDLDGYTYRTADGQPSAHFEHTIVVTEDGADILTRID